MPDRDTGPGDSERPPAGRRSDLAERLLAVAAVVCLGVLVGIAGLTARWSAEVVDRQAEAAHLMEVAGRQRVLTQRIETDVSALADPELIAPVRASVRARLSRTADDLDQVSQAVQHGDVGLGLTRPAPRVVRQLYWPSGLDLDGRIASFSSAARSAAAVPTRLPRASELSEKIHSEANSLLLRDLDAVMTAMADDVRRTLDDLHRQIVVGVIALGLVAVAEVLGVFLPLIRRLAKRRRQSERAVVELRRATALTRALMAGTDVAIIGVDPRSGRAETNPAARALLDLAPDGPISMTQIEERLLSGVLGGQADGPALWAGSHEVELVLPGPQVRRVVLRSEPVPDEDGGPGLVVHVLHDVTVAHERHLALARHADQVRAIGEATRALLHEEDARHTVCRLAREVVGAVMASLYEPDGHGDLVCTAATNDEMVGLRMPINGRSMTVQSFTSAARRVVDRLSADDMVDQDVVERLSSMAGQPLLSGVWVPVISRGCCVGVLAAGFSAPQADLTDQLPFLEILAAETAVALERQDLLLRLAAEAVSDGLTGAGNRRHWEEQLPPALREARSAGLPVAVLVLDFDHFKAYNDTFGHPAGDSLLRRSVQAWRQWLRPTDLLCRYGGEEFAVLLRDCSAEDAVSVAENLRAAVSDGQSCSVGVAAWDGKGSAHDLVSRADHALYQAKADGRNCVRVAESAGQAL